MLANHMPIFAHTVSIVEPDNGMLDRQVAANAVLDVLACTQSQTRRRSSQLEALFGGQITQRVRDLHDSIRISHIDSGLADNPRNLPLSLGVPKLVADEALTQSNIHGHDADMTATLLVVGQDKDDTARHLDREGLFVTTGLQVKASGVVHERMPRTFTCSVHAAELVDVDDATKPTVVRRRLDLLEELDHGALAERGRGLLSPVRTERASSVDDGGSIDLDVRHIAEVLGQENGERGLASPSGTNQPQVMPFFHIDLDERELHRIDPELVTHRTLRSLDQLTNDVHSDAPGPTPCTVDRDNTHAEASAVLDLVRAPTVVADLDPQRLHPTEKARCQLIIDHLEDNLAFLMNGHTASLP